MVLPFATVRRVMPGQISIDGFSRLKLVLCPRSLAATCAALPSMSLIPFAPFILHNSSFILICESYAAGFDFVAALFRLRGRFRDFAAAPFRTARRCSEA